MTSRMLWQVSVGGAVLGCHVTPSRYSASCPGWAEEGDDVPQEHFSVRVNVPEGLIEIEGDDKEWVAAQLDKLSAVYLNPPETAPPPADTPERKQADTSPTTPRRSRRAGGGGGRVARNPNLVKLLTGAVKKKLEAYQKERSDQWDKHGNQLAIIATFLLDQLSWSGVDTSDLYTVYS